MRVPDEIKSVAVRSAKKAGKVLMRMSKENFVYRVKNKYDILSEADLESEKIIINEIKKAFPDHDILSEEAGKTTEGSDFLWVIDPLDGTINYSKKIKECCISIAVAHENEIVLGVIYQPFSKKMYMAEKGVGAFVNGKKLRVSAEKKIINMILATETTSNIEKRKLNYEILSKVCHEVRSIRVSGSGASDFARIACGKIDIFFQTNIHYWDYAAGALLIEEAGGQVTDFEGEKITESSKNIVASNGTAHEKIISMLNIYSTN